MKAKLVLLFILAVSLLAFGKVKSGIEPCANSISCINDLSGKFEEVSQDAVWHGTKASIPSFIAGVIPATKYVLGETTGEKRIEVDLTRQRVYAFEGDNRVFDFPISSGKWYPTPTGEFRVWVKLRYTKMEGGNKADNTYYYLPNVPYVMFFYNDKIAKARGFALHGTYWHNNFGHPMSHGCVNMRTENVAQLYAWAGPSQTANTTYASSDNPGIRIIIYGEAPRE